MTYPPKFTAAFQQRRETVLQAALADGRINGASYQGWARRFDADPQGTEQTLQRLYPVVQAEPFPVHAAAPGATQQAYPQEWLTPAERARMTGEPRKSRIWSD